MCVCVGECLYIDMKFNELDLKSIFRFSFCLIVKFDIIIVFDKKFYKVI